MRVASIVLGMAPVTPQQLASSRLVIAESVLRNEVDFRGYPHRHLAVVTRPRMASSSITQLLEAVEYLSHFGWELVSVTSATDSRMLYAFLRLR
ncbi:hypothetical protein GA0074694_1269 [Micromonospora inyonensis]|uniref:Uncharacterized protein n=2 Tax=Micromonospora inyonensis TaxID=47866 RepID=A0A1C6REN3_9ACTN|nr:hypothetical protein GA0074694_1269 [Micromonospora inyonensis]